MKRVELLQRLNRMGCVFIRPGGKHDWYQNPRTKMCQPIPRHREIKDHLARAILRHLGDEI
ncbi:MAG: type II toxin-antitoxin system HicA family toxin [Verrucomicrobia bacterium]|nr:type II toxin-antitoxin system HicA family toxin [Verrucomicrobiota bacterium]